jgi:hypothetical protein
MPARPRSVVARPTPLRRSAVAVLVSLAAAATTMSSSPPALAVQAAQATMPSAVPAAYTPDVKGGAVLALGQVGSRVVVGGSFTSVAPHGSSAAVSRGHLFAFDATTGAVDPGFAPAVTGTVSAVAAGPGATVYVAGALGTVNGVALKVALLDLTNGRIVAGWAPPAMNSSATSVVLSGGRLFVGGTFTKVGKSAVSGLVALNPTTGALLPYVKIAVAGHHGQGASVGAVGLKTFDIDRSGTQLVAVGNFATVSDASGTYARDQVFRMTLGTTAASVDAGWNTAGFTSPCVSGAFGADVRDVQFSPDGSYFVIVATGGSGTNTDGTRAPCDAASRWETGQSGADVPPTWVDYTGQDSLWSVAVTGTAVYVGGHQRWLNNTYGTNSAGAGAVPRPGLAALDPANGLPLAWNPGRSPRGTGAQALLATANGLYVGSDTDYIGNYRYQRQKLAYFPLAGGAAAASTSVGQLPGTVFATSLSTPDALTSRHLDAAGNAGAATTVDNGSVMAWSQVRGAFVVGDQMFYGLTSGTFNKRVVSGSSFGPQVTVDPYDDPVWQKVKTGSKVGGAAQTYASIKTGYYAEIPAVTSAFYSGGRLYYTLSGQSQMRYRYFTPDSGVIGAQEFTVGDGLDWSATAGAFLSGSSLYYATRTDGGLHAVAWAGDHASGASRTVDVTARWASGSMFVRSD